MGGVRCVADEVCRARRLFEGDYCRNALMAVDKAEAEADMPSERLMG